MPTSSPEARTLVEAAVQHERRVTVTLLVLIPLACRTWIALMARDMYGTMTGSSARMMTGRWDAPHLVLLWAMWAAMMTAMMLPSASPLILLYAGALRTRGVGHSGRRMAVCGAITRTRQPAVRCPPATTPTTRFPRASRVT